MYVRMIDSIFVQSISTINTLPAVAILKCCMLFLKGIYSAGSELGAELCYMVYGNIIMHTVTDR